MAEDFEFRLLQLERRVSDRLKRPCWVMRRYGSPLIAFLNTQFGGWLLTYALVGLLAFLYQTVWVPNNARDDRREAVLLELAFRTASAIKNGDRTFLTGSDENYVTNSKFIGNPFRHLTWELRTLVGREKEQLLRYAFSPPKDDAELRDFLQILITLADDYSVNIIALEEFPSTPPVAAKNPPAPSPATPPTPTK